MTSTRLEDENNKTFLLSSCEAASGDCLFLCERRGCLFCSITRLHLKSSTVALCSFSKEEHKIIIMGTQASPTKWKIKYKDRKCFQFLACKVYIYIYIYIQFYYIFHFLYKKRGLYFVVWEVVLKEDRPPLVFSARFSLALCGCSVLLCVNEVKWEGHADNQRRGRRVGLEVCKLELTYLIYQTKLACANYVFFLFKFCACTCS